MLISLYLFLIISLPSSIARISSAPVQLKLLLFVTIAIITQGVWMLANYKFIFIEDSIVDNIYHRWQLLPNKDQLLPHSPGAISQSEAVDRLTSIIPTLLATLSIAILTYFKRLKFQSILIAIFWTTVAVALLGISQRLSGATGSYWLDTFSFPSRQLFFGTYRSPAIACCLLNLSLAIGLSHLLATARKCIRSRKSKPSKVIAIAFGNILIACGSIQSGSKAGAVFTIITLIVWLTWNYSASWKTIRQFRELLPGSSPTEKNIILTALTAIILILSIAVAGTVINRWADAQESNYNTIEARKSINETQLKMIQDPDWGALGFGPGSFYPLYPYYKTEAEEKSHQFYAHNDHLQTLVEWGWLGGSLLYFIYGGALFLLLKNILRNPSKFSKQEIYYQKGMTIGLVIISLHALIDFPFQIESIALITECLIAIAWGLKPRSSASKQT